MLKPDIEAAMRSAALASFAENGFAASSMAEMAATAGVATGNFYRYFADKQALFDAVLPDSVAATLEDLVARRVEAAGQDEDRYRVMSRDLLAFAIEHRHAVIVLLGRAQGTRYAEFSARLRMQLERAALSHFGLSSDDRLGATLRRVYQSFLAAIVDVLAEDGDPARIHADMDAYARYHLAGLEALCGSRSR